MLLTWLDWSIIGAYLVFAIGLGVYFRKSASASVESYFLADRNFPWWLLGVSMVATTFAADTPLAVTGIIANGGISGNWFWWSLALSHLLVVVLVARFWRRTEVVTDAEVVELRYDGKGAVWLRGIKAFFFALAINCLIMGWVIRAMGKIMHSFVDWQVLLPSVYTLLQQVWPASWAISDAGEGVSTLILAVVALVYASLGGLRSVVVTDLVQFILAMGGAILLAVFAVDHVGGVGPMVDQLHALYPENADEILSFLPTTLSTSALFAFTVFVTVQWWAQHMSDGGGYFAQRILAAKDEDHGYRGTLLFTILHYLVRTWPWVLVGLVALIVFPMAPAPGISPDPEYARVLADREAAYPVLIARLLPAGLMGLMVASLMGAFMSTIDTHINWGSSYLVNDFYRRFLRPKAAGKELIIAAQVSSVLVLAVAVAVATQIHSIQTAWEVLTAMGAGLGLPHLLRWVWRRPSAWSELAALASATLTTAVVYWVTPELEYPAKLLWVVGISTASFFAVTFLGPRVSQAHLDAFFSKVRPAQGKGLLRVLAIWLAACALMVVSLFALHQLFVGNRLLGAVLTVSCAGVWIWMLRKGRSAPQTPVEDGSLPG